MPVSGLYTLNIIVTVYTKCHITVIHEILTYHSFLNFFSNYFIFRKQSGKQLLLLLVILLVGVTVDSIPELGWVLVLGAEEIQSTNLRHQILLNYHSGSLHLHIIKSVKSTNDITPKGEPALS
jgi:hypothetical protein